MRAALRTPKESESFQALFPSLRYLPGGVESGFDPAQPDIFQAGGIAAERCKERSLDWVGVAPSHRQQRPMPMAFPGPALVFDGRCDSIRSRGQLGVMAGGRC